VAVVVACVIVFAIGSCSGTTVDANEIVVKQDFADGQLQVWDGRSQAGWRWTWGGRTTRYPQSRTYWYSARTDEGKAVDESIKVRFNDGGHGNISGSLRYDLPLDAEHMKKLHSKYGSMAAIDHELIAQVVNKSVYMTGPLMSSRESYAERRNDLINYITDQILYGVYKTTRRTVREVDPVSNLEKTVDRVEPLSDPKASGGIAREEVSPLIEFNIKASNITVNSIAYDEAVEAQIKQQQAAYSAVQQAQVDARKAEQAAITAKAQGEAEAAKARADQEVKKAQAVTEAEQQRDVAKLALETAQLQKQATITEAEGMAKAKQLAQQANNNLELKLNAWVEVNKAYASAMAAQKQVPDVQIGEAKGGGTSDLQALLMTATAKQLELNLNQGR
jgi:hypothetical protein